MILDLQRKDPWNGDLISVTTYYGYSKAGTQDSDPLWSIKRKVISNGVLKYEYPSMEVPTGLQWDLRTSYTYSEQPPSNAELIGSGIWNDNNIWMDIEAWRDNP